MKLQILEADLAEFKEIILNKIQKAIRFRFNKSAYMNDLNNGTDDTPQHLKPLRKVKPCLKKQTHNWRFVEKFIEI
jgi:hypothetical protein